MYAKDIPKISLKAARVNAGFTQKESAKMLGIAQETLRSYEEGKTVPGWDTVELIERLYNFPISHIFFGRKLALSDRKQ